MLQKVNDVFQIKFQIIDILGKQVMTAAPVCQIIRKDTNKYWNGFAWQSGAINLSLMHFDGGLYTKDFVFTEAGTYTVNCDDYMYDNHSVTQVDVYSGVDVELSGIKDIDFTFKLLVTDADGNRVSGALPTIKIRSDDTGLYWDGISWVFPSTYIPMNEFYNGLYVYIFNPDIVGMYSIASDENVNNVHAAYSLNVLDPSVLSGQPRVASSETILGPDGGASDVVDEFGSVIQGAKITAYNTSDESSSSVISFTDGTWSMYLKPGTYVFMFEKEGYTSASFERVVI